MNQHYIPQFWIKNFCSDIKDGFVDYFNKKTNKKSFRHSSEIFFCHDLYRETDIEDAQYIERELSRFENDIQPIFNKILNDKEIVLASNEYEKFFIFLYIQFIRTYKSIVGIKAIMKLKKANPNLLKDVLSDNLDANLNKWRNDIFELSKIRSLEDIGCYSSNKDVFSNLKSFYSQYSLVFFESKDETFVLSDAVPISAMDGVMVFGTLPFFIFPISPKRAAVLSLNEMVNNKFKNSLFSCNKLRIAVSEKDGKKTLKMKPRIVYRKEVQNINEKMINDAIEGYVFVE